MCGKYNVFINENTFETSFNQIKMKQGTIQSS